MQQFAQYYAISRKTPSTKFIDLDILVMPSLTAPMRWREGEGDDRRKNGPRTSVGLFVVSNGLNESMAAARMCSVISPSAFLQRNIFPCMWSTNNKSNSVSYNRRMVFAMHSSLFHDIQSWIARIYDQHTLNLHTNKGTCWSTFRHIGSAA